MEQSGNGSLLLPELQKLASQLKPSAFIGRPGQILFRSPGNERLTNFGSVVHYGRCVQQLSL